MTYGIDEFADYLADAMRDPVFAKRYRRAKRRSRSQRWMYVAVSVKSSRRTVGWRRA